jgi:hypothetical protein
VCVLGDENLHSCLRDAITERLPALHNPKRHEVYDTIDPFFFDHAKLFFNDSQNFRGSFSIKNMLIEGGSKINFKKVVVKQRNNSMKVLGVIHIPAVQVDGLFKSNLRIDNFLFKSSGNFNGSIEDMHGKFVLSGELIETEGGLSQFKVERFNIFFVIIDMKIHLYGSQIDDNLSEYLKGFVLYFKIAFHTPLFAFLRYHHRPHH